MWYWIAVSLLLVVNACGVFANLLMLPGNWVMVGAIAIFVFALPFERGPEWPAVATVLALAVVGEVLEAVTGSARAAKKGASRRAVVLSFVLSIVGSIAGAFVIPIPVLGSAVGAIAGAAAGAFSGAWLGEAWMGSEIQKRHDVGRAAMSGRMIGMLAKMSVGVAIFVFELFVLLT